MSQLDKRSRTAPVWIPRAGSRAGKKKSKIMKKLFWIGIVLLVLGVVSRLFPIPHTEREGVKAGGISLGVETRP